MKASPLAEVAAYLWSRGNRYICARELDGLAVAPFIAEGMRSIPLPASIFPRAESLLWAASAFGELTGLPSILCLRADELSLESPLEDAPFHRLAAEATPILLIVECRSEDEIERLLEASAVSSKLALTLDRSSYRWTLPRAWETAFAEPTGPVVLAYHASELANFPGQVDEDKGAGFKYFDQAELGVSAATNSGALERLAREIDEARSPIVVIGSGARNLDWGREMKELAEKLAGPVFIFPKAKGLFDETHPLFAGIFDPTDASEWTTDGYDLIVGLGLRPIETPVSLNVSLINLTPDPESEDYRIDRHQRVEDQRSLAHLARSLRRKRPAHKPAVRSQKAKNDSELMSLRANCPDETILICDSDELGRAGARLWTCRYPRTFLTPSLSDQTGFAWPAALVTRILLPDRPLVVLSKDRPPDSMTGRTGITHLSRLA